MRSKSSITKRCPVCFNNYKVSKSKRQTGGSKVKSVRRYDSITCSTKCSKVYQACVNSYRMSKKTDIYIDLIKQIKSELKFLNCQGIKSCVKMADFGTCHNPCPTIENRKNKLKKQINDLIS